MPKALGRPRDSSSKKSILRAALSVLKTRAYSDFSIEEVARRAGAGKSTIYRWWHTRAELAVEAVFDATLSALVFEDTGIVAEDFRRQLKKLAAILRGSRGVVLAALITGSQHDGELRRAIGERWVKPRREWGVQKLRQAQATGEALPTLDSAAALDALYCPFYAHLFLGLPAHSDAEVDRLCDLLFPQMFREVRGSA